MRYLVILVVICAYLPTTLAQEPPAPYAISDTPRTEIWIDPTDGSDNNSGAQPDQALETLNAAWNLIPPYAELSSGYHIYLLPGSYPAESVPVYWESRYGTADAPIIIEGTAPNITLPNLNIFDTRYLYLINLTITGGGDVFHCEKCDHLLLRNITVIGADPETFNVQEAVKINQSQHIYIEDSDVAGAWDNAIDFVAVQYGHVINSRIHNAGDWCMYTKGGSAEIRIADNAFFDCGTGGFTAGQGTGFEYMVAPWLQYEAYDIQFVNNVVHHTEGAAVGVNGGYNILIADNVFYQVGTRSHGIEVVFGLRSCDGDTEQCQLNLDQGGWGTATIGSEEPIPNAHVYIYNNVLYNPAGVQSQWQHFAIYAPRIPSAGSNIPDPATTDADLQIRGNLIWNGGAELPLGIESDAGCQPDNPTCNADQLRAENTINILEPQLVDPENGDYGVVEGFNWETFPIPDFH